MRFYKIKILSLLSYHLDHKVEYKREEIVSFKVKLKIKMYKMLLKDHRYLCLDYKSYGKKPLFRAEIIYIKVF